MYCRMALSLKSYLGSYDAEIITSLLIMTFLELEYGISCFLQRLGCGSYHVILIFISFISAEDIHLSRSC